jgi:hypothetical protein
MYFLSYLGIITAIGLFITNIFIAMGVFQDARRLQSEIGKGLKLFTPEIWALICFFGSIPGLAVYLAIHHTTLAK